MSEDVKPYTTLVELEAAHALFDNPPRFPVTSDGAEQLMRYRKHVQCLFITARAGLKDRERLDRLLDAARSGVQL